MCKVSYNIKVLLVLCYIMNMIIYNEKYTSWKCCRLYALWLCMCMYRVYVCVCVLCVCVCLCVCVYTGVLLAL